jgi:hypothetical protein
VKLKERKRAAAAALVVAGIEEPLFYYASSTPNPPISEYGLEKRVLRAPSVLIIGAPDELERRSARERTVINNLLGVRRQRCCGMSMWLLK